MLPYPQINPVAVAIGPLQIHWYGLMYLIGIGGAWLLASRRLNRFDPTWTKEKLSDMVFWMSMGVIVGGRLGYVLFYDLPAYIANPTLIFEVWKGGMAFHGGFVGVMIAAWWFGRRNGKSFFQLMDFIDAVRAEWKGLMFVRISSTDYEEGGRVMSAPGTEQIGRASCRERV